MLILWVHAVVRLPGHAGVPYQSPNGGNGILRDIKLSCTLQNCSGNVVNMQYKKTELDLIKKYIAMTGIRLCGSDIYEL
jgi:hypothetical protein